MMKTFSKFIALMLTLVFVVSVMPLGALAEIGEKKTGTINYQAWANARNGSGAGTRYSLYSYNPTTYGINLNSSTGTNDRRGYAQVDFSGYEEILENEGTAVTMRFTTSTGGTYSIKYLNVYAMDDSADFYSSQYSSAAAPLYKGDMAVRMSLNEATAAGLNDYNGRGTLIVCRSDATTTGDYKANVNVNDLVSVLRTGTDNSLISLSFKSVKGTQYIFTSPNYSNTNVTVTYDSSKINDKEYVSAKADEIKWEDISSQEITAIENDINLPSKYRGADVTWVSDNEAVITSDGKVTLGIGAKSANLTATFSYKGIDSEEASTATKTFTVTVASEPTKETTIPYSNYAHARSDKENNCQEYSINDKDGQHYIQAGGIWCGFAQFNLAGYEEILNNPNTKLQFKIRAGNGFSSKLYPFKVYLAPSSANGYEQASVTYNSAKALGIFDTTRPLLAQSDGTTYVGNGSWITVDADKEALLQVLNETGNNGFVTMWFAPTANSQIRIKEKGEETTNGGLIITYYESEIDDKAHFEAVKSDFGWDKLTIDSTESLTNDLPAYFRGAKITWSADVPGVVSADGKVTQHIDKENTIKLTANVEYKGYSFSETFNNVTVPKEELKSVVVPLNYGTYISSSARSKPQGGYDSSYYSRYMYPIGLYPNGNDRMVFLNWDFSDVLAQLNAARGISINLKSVSGHTQAGSGTKFSVLPDGYESWKESDLTYDIAVEKGLYTEPAIASVKRAPISSVCEITSSAEILNAIKKSVANNPDDAIVNFRWEAIGQTPTEYRLENNNKNNFTITLYYYDSELASGKELANSKVESMPWSFVSNQQIDKVISDLTLPATFYGESVAWESSNESVITSSGEVIPGDEDTAVTLTATVNGLKKEFKVTVPANTNFVLGSKQADYVSATVWSKEACDSCVLVVATYIDDTLYAVDVRDKNFTLAKGENFIWTKLDGNKSGEIVKIMLLKDMETIMPLAIAK